ncbi:RNase HII [Palleronia aestuarii]|uniref:Ribonuclease HII n=2 Tax=Palleronia aestuarii TaxID=568105 RepID=A0A2W7NKJ7_9RHOB|nr:ribonuclease HII [Palleronia aestuarii]PZX11822.1 RNase HII [Palleronia aestuarii]
MPDLHHERRLRADGYRYVAGIDEVGRGPLAGPVVAAAVILGETALPPGVADSKTLRPLMREALAAELESAAQVGIGSASVEEIDAINILQATFLAMRRAVEALPIRPDYVLVDGNRLPGDLPCPGTPLVRGDALSLSIAAASIVAKVARDRVMVDLAQHHPGYGWERNMGYGTKEHLVGLKSHGITPHHRRSFRPIHNILYQAETSTR